MIGERGPKASNVSEPGRMPVKGCRYAPNRHRLCRFTHSPRLHSATLPLLVAEAPLGKTKADCEGERTEDIKQHPRCQRLPSFFYWKRFLTGPRPPDLQLLMEETPATTTVDEDDGGSKPRQSQMENKLLSEPLVTFS